VVVAVGPVRVVQVALDEVVDVVPVRYPLVPARRAVNVSLGMPGAAVRRRAVRRVRGADLERVIVDVVSVHVVKMTVVEIIDVVAVVHRDVAAARRVRVRVALVDLALFLRHSC
jgi:hypothetical protein